MINPCDTLNCENEAKYRDSANFFVCPACRDKEIAEHGGKHEDYSDID